MVVPRGPRPPSGYPTLLDLHGGPVAQHQYEFDFAWQVFAAQGYAVIAPNPRGSSGQGERFQRLLWGEWGHVDLPDVLGAVDHAARAGVADAKRLGVGGWSYGAILTNYVIASDSRFRAAISGAGMSNMLAGYGIDHYVRDWEAEIGLPWQNTEQWLRLSYPFLHADRIKTPTLFMCGEQDFNVPLAASEQMYQALRRLGVPTQLIIYPDEHHGLSRPSFREDRLRRSLDWYDRHLAPQ
jgi:dipeptidyl aminopeptidase/acylaminoacyl peptidase